MSLPPYYENYLTNISRTPNQTYLDNAQAFNNSIWGNSTQTSFTVLEEDSLGAGTYHEVDISVDMAIELSTGNKKSDDWKIFSFKSLTGETQLGLLYKYAQNYWLSCNTDELGGATKSVEVRRCNNFLKWVDKTNGNINSFPCVVDYTIQSPQPSKNKDVVVAGGHIVVWVQGNAKTLSLTKNQRFIFNGQPYKLTSYNNLLQNNIVDVNTTILYYDMYLDVSVPDDDLVNNVANATEYVYTINLSSSVTKQVNGYSGKLDCIVCLNGENVDRTIVYTGNEYVTVNQNGTYSLTGANGDVAVITANIEGNPNLTDSVNIEIVDTVVDEYTLDIEPNISTLRQNDSIVFSVNEYKNGTVQTVVPTFTTSGANDDTYSLIQNGNSFTLGCVKFSQTPLTITFNSENATTHMTVDLKPLF